MSEPLTDALVTAPISETNGINLIATERLRQINDEGYDEAHDRNHASELMMAAESYLSVARYGADAFHHPDGSFAPPGGWPWTESAWKPKNDRVRDLTIAGALIAAALDALTSPTVESSTFTCFGGWVDDRLQIDYTPLVNTRTSVPTRSVGCSPSAPARKQQALKRPCARYSRSTTPTSNSGAPPHSSTTAPPSDHPKYHEEGATDCHKHSWPPTNPRPRSQ